MYSAGNYIAVITFIENTVVKGSNILPQLLMVVIVNLNHLR